MAAREYSLVFGAGDIGLMGECARAVHKGGGKVIGVIPEALNKQGIYYPHCDQMHVTQTMRERKQMMEELACGFIALPGGFGTLEEVLEIITLKQLRYHTKPIVLLNVGGFYNALIEQFKRTIAENFAKAASRALYYITNNEVDAVEYIKNYVHVPIAEKWLTATDPRPERVH